MESEQPPSEGIDPTKPIRVVDVKFKGVKRTQPRLLAKVVADVFASNSLLDCMLRSEQVRLNLISLGIFSDVELLIEAPDDECKITFVVEEQGRIRARAHTAVDNNSTSSLDAELTSPNLTGRGDYLKLSTQSMYGKAFYSSECRYSLPILPWRILWNPIYSIFYSQYQHPASPTGLSQSDKSIVNQVEFLSMPNMHHSFSFENVWRYLRSDSKKTPIEIREQSGHSVKSSLKHMFTWDNRAFSGNFPYSGLMARLTNESTLNLVKGSIKFTRHEVELQANALILPQHDLLCQLNILGGFLRPSKINICDKFFAGGALTMRGFEYRGLGPNVNGHPLGDLSYLNAGIHLYSRLPFVRHDNNVNSVIRPHMFFNAGTLGDISDIWRLHNKESLKKELFRLRDSMRYSCGFGLVASINRMRFEINYCVPLISKGNDLCMRGPQWGFGITYS